MSHERSTDGRQALKENGLSINVTVRSTESPNLEEPRGGTGRPVDNAEVEQKLRIANSVLVAGSDMQTFAGVLLP